MRALHALALLRAVHTVQLHLPPVLQVPRRHGRLLPGAPRLQQRACLLTLGYVKLPCCCPLYSKSLGDMAVHFQVLPGAPASATLPYFLRINVHVAARIIYMLFSTLMPSLLTQAGLKHLHTS